MDFTNCTPASDRYDLDTSLLDILDYLESLPGVGELKINSAYRSQSYEVRMGRNGLSAHCLGKAVDIACYDSKMRYLIIKAALQKGIHRIGVYKSFIHLDVATAKDGKNGHVLWHG